MKVNMMNMNKTPIKEQEPNIRNKNFDEVILGYDDNAAIEEANRCLNCKNKPCVSGCPVNINIPEFISYIKDGNIQKAYEIIRLSNTLPAICGRVCPQETQCEAKCVRGIKGDSVAIGRLERYVADWVSSNNMYSNKTIKKNGNNVAIIGSGPSGLACAGDLALIGYNVTIFEALHLPGGVLTYGIPSFRLPKKIVEEEILQLTNLGVKIETNVVIGKTLGFDDLLNNGFDAIYIGTGAGLPNFMGIPGENLIGVYSANEFLTRINLMNAYLDDYDTPLIKPSNIAIIGGGNVAMDAARCAKRLGAENVYVVYRRSKEEMPARKEEITHAKEEQIEFKLLTNPIRILDDGNGKVCGLECREMDLGEVDETGRRKPIEKKGTEFIIDVDSVIIAIGNSPNYLISNAESNIRMDNKGHIIVDDNLKTLNEKIYAGGDIVTGAATVILAMGAGKKAAKSIDEYLKNK